MLNSAGITEKQMQYYAQLNAFSHRKTFFSFSFKQTKKKRHKFCKTPTQNGVDPPHHQWLIYWCDNCSEKTKQTFNDINFFWSHWTCACMCYVLALNWAWVKIDEWGTGKCQWFYCNLFFSVSVVKFPWFFCFCFCFCCFWIHNSIEIHFKFYSVLSIWNRVKHASIINYHSLSSLSSS